MPESYLTPHFEDGGRLMITNNGPHPAELWAQATAEHIAPIAPEVTGKRRIAAMALQAAIMEALQPHYDDAQSKERDKLTADTDYVMSDLDASDHVKAAVTSIQGAAKDTDWEAHFQRPEVVDMISGIMMTHFHTAQMVERGWHIDRNPDHPNAAEFNTLRGRA